MFVILRFWFLFSFLLLNFVSSENVSVMKKIRDCLSQEHATICLKEKALDAINQTIISDAPFNIYGLVDIVKDPNYIHNSTDDYLPSDLIQRNVRLNKMLYDKVEEFVHSRSVKMNLANIFEGRAKKGGGGKKGGMLMLGGLAMMGMVGQLFMGKIAFMAGAALLIAKMALMLSAIIGLKKLSSGSGGGGESHIVYTSSSDSGYGHSHGGGGWHRSLDQLNDAQNMAYSSYVTEANYSE